MASSKTLQGGWRIMDAVKYIKEKQRMCNSFVLCKGCEIDYMLKVKAMPGSCINFFCENPEKAVSIVEKWSAEHPAKTRKSEFLKMFPNARILYINDNKVIDILPCAIDKDLRKSNCDNKITCSECKLNYWLAEVE